MWKRGFSLASRIILKQHNSSVQTFIPTSEFSLAPLLSRSLRQFSKTPEGPLGTKDALDKWGAAMECGDWDTAWNIFEEQFSVDGPEFAPLEELLSWDPEEENRAARRQKELSMQQDIASSRVRHVDTAGRAHAVGRRKESVARVWLQEGQGHVLINRRQMDDYFPALLRRNDIVAPLLATGTIGIFDIMAKVEGGGLTGQAQAVRHGIARALQLFDPSMRPALKSAGLLTRDARVVERKKPGLKKARKAFQWVKR